MSAVQNTNHLFWREGVESKGERGRGALVICRSVITFLPNYADVCLWILATYSFEIWHYGGISSMLNF